MYLLFFTWQTNSCGVAIGIIGNNKLEVIDKKLRKMDVS